MIYERVLVGIDGSSLALDACRMASQLRAPWGRLLALAVAETPYARFADLRATEWESGVRARAQHARETVLREFEDDPRVTAEVTTGYANERLLQKIADFDADLVAIGTRGLSRSAGLTLGSVATHLIRDAPCSVLVARRKFKLHRFPRDVLVGVDGSEHASRAAVVADALGDAVDARVNLMRAPRDPVHTLVEASATVDLLVVGNRGEHGFSGLGTVAERVANEAYCPVLIVRNPSPRLRSWPASGRRDIHAAAGMVAT